MASEEIVAFDASAASEFITYSRGPFTNDVDRLGLDFVTCFPVHPGGDDWVARLAEYRDRFATFDSFVQSVRDDLDAGYDLSSLSALRVGHVAIVIHKTTGGRIDYESLSDDELEVLMTLRPDLILEAEGLPDEVRIAAEDKWHELVADLAPTISTHGSVRAEVNFAWVQISAEASEEMVTYASGKTVLTLELSGSLGAAFSVGAGEVGVGAETGVWVEYEFDSYAEAELFRQTLHSLIATANIGGVVVHLGSEDASNLVIYGGVYVEGEFEFGSEMELELSVSGGVGKDLATDETVYYLDAEGEFEFEVGDHDYEVNGTFEAEYRSNDDGPSGLTVSGSLAGSAEELSDYFDLPDGFEAGGGVWIEIDLDLANNPEALEAFENFKSTGNFLELWRYGTVTMGGFTTVKTEEIEFDIAAVEFEAEAGVSAFGPTMIRQPGGSWRTINPGAAQ